MKQTSLLVAVAFVLPIPALAGDDAGAPRPSFTVGHMVEFTDKFVTVDCQRWEVKELDRDGYRVSQCGENLAYFDNGTGRLVKIVTEDGDKLAQFKPALPTIDFPLAVGKTWSGSYDGYTNDNGAMWSGDTDCKVEAKEPVKVAAGELEAYRIACSDNWEAPPFSGVSDSVSWYAPEVGAVVKTVNKQDSRWNSELKAYSTGQ